MCKWHLNEQFFNSYNTILTLFSISLDFVPGVSHIDSINFVTSNEIYKKSENLPYAT